MAKGLFVKTEFETGEYSSNRYSFITVKFAEMSNQSVQKKSVERALRSVSEAGDLSVIEIKAVFPGSEDPELSTIFVTKVEGAVERALKALREIKGIQYVHLSSERKLLGANEF